MKSLWSIYFGPPTYDLVISKDDWIDRCTHMGYPECYKKLTMFTYSGGFILIPENKNGLAKRKSA